MLALRRGSIGELSVAKSLPAVAGAEDSFEASNEKLRATEGLATRLAVQGVVEV